MQTSLYYDYVTVPALSELKILNKLPVYIVGGLNLSIPVNVSEINITNHTGTHEHDPTPLQLAIMGGIGGELQIASKISLIFELNRKKSITKPETDMGDYVTDFELFSTNLSAGIRYNL